MPELIAFTVLLITFKQRHLIFFKLCFAAHVLFWLLLRKGDRCYSEMSCNGLPFFRTLIQTMFICVEAGLGLAFTIFRFLVDNGFAETLA